MTGHVLITHKRLSVKGEINVTLSKKISYGFLPTSYSVRRSCKSCYNPTLYIHCRWSHTNNLLNVPGAKVRLRYLLKAKQANLNPYTTSVDFTLNAMLRNLAENYKSETSMGSL